LWGVIVWGQNNAIIVPVFYFQGVIELDGKKGVWRWGNIYFNYKKVNFTMKYNSIL